MSEDEVASLAYQSLPLLANVHNHNRLHNNITHKTLRITSAGVVILRMNLTNCYLELIICSVDEEPEDETKMGGASIKFKAPEPEVSVASDTYLLYAQQDSNY